MRTLMMVALLASCGTAEPAGEPAAGAPAGLPADTVSPVVPGDTSPPPDTGWTAGITDELGGEAGVATLSDVRLARNEGFDRLVLEFREEELPGYAIEYVDRPVRQCGSGEPVEIAGDGWLQVRLVPARAHDEEGKATITERSVRPELPVVVEAVVTCDFEAHVEWVLGVRSPNPYRVLRLRNPARLVIDVRHD